MGFCCRKFHCRTCTPSRMKYFRILPFNLDVLMLSYIDSSSTWESNCCVARVCIDRSRHSVDRRISQVQCLRRDYKRGQPVSQDGIDSAHAACMQAHDFLAYPLPTQNKISLEIRLNGSHCFTTLQNACRTTTGLQGEARCTAKYLYECIYKKMCYGHKTDLTLFDHLTGPKLHSSSAKRPRAARSWGDAQRESAKYKSLCFRSRCVQASRWSLSSGAGVCQSGLLAAWGGGRS